MTPTGPTEPAPRVPAGAPAARAATVLAGCAVVLAAAFVPSEPVDGGGRTLDAWWVAQAGVALALWGRGEGSPARAAWRWAALLLLATAAQLRLTSPLWLQFLDVRPARLAAPGAAAAAGVLAVQGVAVLAALRGRWGAIVRASRGLVSLRAVVCVGIAFAFAAVHVSPFVRRGDAAGAAACLVLYGIAGALLVVNVAHVGLLLRAIPAGTAARWLDAVAAHISLPGGTGPERPLDRWVPRIAAGWTLALTAGLALGVFEGVPHVPDEAAYLFQARCLAEGTVSAPEPPVFEAFTDYLIARRDGAWFSTTNPGWPAALAAGVAVGAPWLVNPVLAALAVLLAHAFASRWTGRGTAHALVALLATSPWFLFLGASFMTHTLTLVLVLGAWLLLSPREGAPRAVPSLAAGLLLGAIVVVRPLDGLLAGAATGVFLLASLGLRLGTLVPFAAGCVAGALPLFAFNATLSSGPFSDPMADYLAVLWYPGANRLGFGADVGNVPSRWGGLDPLPGHGLADVLVNANQNFYNLNFEAWGWALGSLALPLVHLAWGTLARTDRWMCGLGAAVVAGYSIYWFSGGPDFGARYWYLAIVPLAWLTVRGLGTLVALLADRVGVEAAAARAGIVACLLAGVAVVTFVPWRAIGRYADYRGFHADYARMAASGELGRSLVLVSTERVADAASALAMNPPRFDDARPLFARDLGPEVEQKLRAAFPDRPVVRVQGRRAAGDRARRVEATR